MLTYRSTEKDKFIFKELIKASKGDLNLVFKALNKFRSESKDRKYYTIEFNKLLKYIKYKRRS